MPDPWSDFVLESPAPPPVDTATEWDAFIQEPSSRKIAIPAFEGIQPEELAAKQQELASLPESYPGQNLDRLRAWRLDREGITPVADVNRGMREFYGRADKEENLGAVSNLIRSARTAAGEVVAGGLGLISPEAGATAAAGSSRAIGGYEPESITGIAGTAAGSLVPAVMIGAISGGSGLPATLLALSSGGQSRATTRVKRTAEGQQISGTQEWLAAAGNAAAEYIGERFGLGAILKGGGSFVRRTLVSMGINASEEFVTQVLQNATDKLTGITPDQKLFEGATLAGITGGVGGSLAALPAFRGPTAGGLRAEAEKLGVDYRGPWIDDDGTPLGEVFNDRVTGSSITLPPGEENMLAQRVQEGRDKFEEAARQDRVKQGRLIPVISEQTFAEREIARRQQEQAEPQRTFVSEPGGLQMSPEQAAARQAAGEQAVRQVGEPGLPRLPIQEQRFEAGPEGMEDIRPPTPRPETTKTGAFVGEENQLEATRRQLDQEKALRRQDDLTKMPNRVAYQEDVDRIFKEADEGGESVAVAESDLNNFKVFQDDPRHGHEKGDQVLRAMGEAIREVLRMPPQEGRPADHAGNIGYRIGGDEFPALLRNIKSKRQAMKVLQRINERFQEKVAKIADPSYPKEAYPAIAWGVELRQPGDTRPVESLRLEAEKGEGNPLSVAKNKARLKRKSGIPSDREGLKKWLAERSPQTTPLVRIGAELRAQRKARREAAQVPPKLKPALSKARLQVEKAVPTSGSSKRWIPRFLEEFVTPLASRVRDISPRIFGRLMQMEFNTGEARERLKRAAMEPARRMVKALEGKDSPTYLRFAEAVFNNPTNPEAVLATVPQDVRPDVKFFLDTFRTLLANARDAGVTIGDLGAGYWPRYLRDYDAFKREFGDIEGDFEEAFNLARSTKGRALLTADEKAAVANQVIQGIGPRKPGSFGPPNARKRAIRTLTAEQLPYYLDPFEAAFRYIDAMTYAAERSRFLGKNHQPAELDETVGRIVQEEIDAGNLDAKNQDELKDLLKARFTADMLTTSKGVRTAKQLIYMTTLGQFRSSLTQLLDVGVVAASHGLKAAYRGTKAALNLTPREHRLMMEDIGLHDHGEEFRDVGRVARTTDTILRRTGLKRLDRFGKESRINAALSKFSGIAAQPQSEAYRRLQRDYTPVLGEEQFNQTMADLRADKKTENVRYLVFLDVTKVQPVTLSQMPQRYLEMPNGRIFYTLKTFTIQQLDYVRRDMFRKLVTPGQRTEGVKNLGQYVLFGTAIGLGVDALKSALRGQLGEDELQDGVIDSLLNLVGMNRYLVDQAFTDPWNATLNFLAPPGGMLKDAVLDLTSSKPGFRTPRYIPLVGELIYYWAPFGRGANLTGENAKKDYRAKLRQLREAAADTVADGSGVEASQLLMIYNDRRRQGPGDGRQNPLTVQDLIKDRQP